MKIAGPISENPGELIVYRWKSTRKIWSRYMSKVKVERRTVQVVTETETEGNGSPTRQRDLTSSSVLWPGEENKHQELLKYE